MLVSQVTSKELGHWRKIVTSNIEYIISCFKKNPACYIYCWKLQFLNNVIIVKV